METELIITGIGLIISVAAVGFRLATILGDIRVSISKIETLVSAHSQTLHQIETDIRSIEAEMDLLRKRVDR